VKKMPFKTLSRIFVTVVLSTTLLGCASANPKQYEGVHNKFVPVGRMVAKRSFHHGILLPNGEVALLSGSTARKYHSTVENYNPETGQFRLTGKLLGSRLYATATLLQNGKILITGGQGTVNGGYSNCQAHAELYDPITETSHLVGNMHQCRVAHQATVLQNGKVLITGGELRANSDKELRQMWKDKVEFTYASTELFDPQTETFTPAANMNDRRDGHQATLLQDGNVLVTGGEGSPKAIGGGTKVQNILDSAELYLAKENRFVQLPKMIYPRSDHHALLLSNGNVVLIGGQTTGQRADKKYGDNVIRQVEQYSFKKKWFDTAGFLVIPKTPFRTILLTNGKVLILSGREETEIYDPKTQTSVPGTNRLSFWNNDSAVRLLNGDVLLTYGHSKVPFDSIPMAELYKF
jgi:hypothetical protein